MRRIFVLLLLFGMYAFAHPFYLGVTDLKYNEQEKALQGSVKLFTNDLEDALKRLTGQTVDLIHPKNKAETEKILRDYLAKRLLVTVNGQQRICGFMGFEHEQEAIWMYIEIQNCPYPKKVTIDNSLLYDYIKEQTNIMHLEVKEEKKSLKVNNPEKQAVFEF